jgi:hypothetical protein
MAGKRNWSTLQHWRVALIVVFIGLAARVFLDYSRREEQLESLRNQFAGEDKVLSAAEVLSWVNKNMDRDPFSESQFKLLFGKFDTTGNGFDDAEILQLADTLDELPSASDYMKDLGGDRQEYELHVTSTVFVIFFILLVANVWLTFIEERETKMHIDHQSQNEAKIQHTLAEKRRENQELQQSIADHQLKMGDLEEKIKLAPQEKKESLQEQHDEFANMVAEVKADLDSRTGEIANLNQDLSTERAKWNKHMTGIDAIRALFRLQQKNSNQANSLDGATQGCNFEVKIFGGLSTNGTLQMYVHENVLVQGKMNKGVHGEQPVEQCMIGVSKCRDLCTGEPKAYKRYIKADHTTDISNELKTLNTLVRDDTADPRASMIVQYDAVFETDTGEMMRIIKL